MGGWSPQTLVRYGFCREDVDGRIVSIWNSGELEDVLRDIEDGEVVDTNKTLEDLYIDMPNLEPPKEIQDLYIELHALERAPYADEYVDELKQVVEDDRRRELPRSDLRLGFRFICNVIFLYVLCRVHNIPNLICWELFQELVHISIKHNMILADCV
ncbi:hypothetical protein M758_UG166700 [Ceratodon purpureus]|nr:hypothetical protein M758_UG166700 [Ceratodon purpureus]